MDLVNAVVGMKQAQCASQIQMAVAKKVMDSEKMNGAAALKLLEAASAGATAATDSAASAAMGLGAELDVYG